MILDYWCNAIIFVILICTPVSSVKEYLFKKCEQNGFCNRNRYFANKISTHEGHYVPRYSLNRSTIKINDTCGYIEGIMLKESEQNTSIELDFKVSIVEDYNLRFQLDESNREQKISTSIVPNPNRYDKAGDWAFQAELNTRPFRHTSFNDHIVLTYGTDDEYKAIIQLYPFKITISYNDIEHIILNDRNFLNMETYKTKEEIDKMINILPEESTFNAYKDSFKDSSRDMLPLGPESVAIDFTFNNYTHVYGIPEHADSFSLKDTTNTEPYRLFNVDIFEYDVQSKLPMYGSIPLMTAVKSDAASAIFWVNAADTYIDILKHAKSEKPENVDLVWSNDELNSVKTHWMSEAGIIDVILMVKSTPFEINQAFGQITGYSALPNIFSLGYHQCRWNYNDESDVLDVHKNFDNYEIPYDTIWLDIEYTDSKKYFTWNKALFPDPYEMMTILEETKRQLVVIVDPHIKSNYDVSINIEKEQIGIKDNTAEKTYHGHCWPGDSVWIDTLNPLAQSFWDSHFSNGTELLGYSSNTHLWNDMNEPSIFNGPETTAPKDLLHFDNYEHRSVHNIYGLSFHEATYHSLLKRNPNQRPFVLTRSFFAGSQRTSAMWTGDNMAKWEYLKESIPMILSMNVAGFGFAGADVGGFFGNPSKELLLRWYQTGIWYPFFRAHAHIDSRRREPWIAGDQYTDFMRDAIRLRYRLLPTLYTQFWKNSLDGSPIMKPLVYENTNDKNAYEIDNEFFLGGLLVHPIVEEDAADVEVYFPCDGEIYYDFFDLSNKFESCQYISVQATLQTIPLYLKGGNIVTTRDRYRRSSQLMQFDPYTIYIAIGSDGKAYGDLYIDDGKSFNYRNGDYIHVRFLADDTSRTLKGYVEHTGNGTFSESFKEKNVHINKIVIVGSNAGSEALVTQKGETWKASCLEKTESGYFIIRNPQVSIVDSWEVNY